MRAFVATATGCEQRLHTFRTSSACHQLVIYILSLCVPHVIYRVHTVSELHALPFTDLVRVLGTDKSARQILGLSYGVDDAPVVASGSHHLTSPFYFCMPSLPAPSLTVQDSRMSAYNQVHRQTGQLLT